MAGFIERKVKSLTLGEKLKKIREKSGVSLSELATNTKVKREYLEKIEAGDYEQLPFDVYVKGFLRSYAKFLSLNPEKVIAQFEKEVGVRENVKKYQNKSKNGFDLKIPNLTITPKIVSIVSSILIILTGVVYFYLEVDDFSKKPDLTIDSPVTNRTIDGSSVDVIGSTDFENKVTINGEPIYIDSEGKFRESVGLQKGANEIIVEAFNKFGKSTQRLVNISANYELAVLGVEDSPKETEEEQSGFSLEMKTLENQWASLEIKIDDNENKKVTLQPGISSMLDVNEMAEITSGKIDGIYVRIDEGDFFVLGESKENFKKIILNKEGKINQDE